MTRPLLITHRPDTLQVSGLPWSDRVDLRHPLDVEADPAAWLDTEVVICDAQDLLLLTALHSRRRGTLLLVGTAEDAETTTRARRLAMHHGAAFMDCETSRRALLTILDRIHAGDAGPILEALTRD